MRTTSISHEQLAALLVDLVGAGTTVIAPARAERGHVDYRPISSLAEAVFDGGMPRRSLKELFLPPTEPLLTWRYVQGAVELRDVPTTFAPCVVLGARPCDAAALDVVDRVMDWDYHDELWFGRRAATTVVSLACSAADASCFCLGVGLAPDSAKGADILLRPAGEGFLAEVVSEKGEALVAAHSDRFRPAPEPLIPAAAAADAQSGPRPSVPAPLPLPAIRSWLESNFEHPVWEQLALRCHGCGACAAVCPTCHCFDIVDEPEGVAHGTRRRNWDTCQTGRFTVHASGHNPRASQTARIRQRVMHKFAIYPAKFAQTLCSGCGRCARECPAGMDLPEILALLTSLATAPTQPKEVVA
jgi:ferredoxin